MASYTEITEIVAPAEAVVGSKVGIIVRIKNIGSVITTIMAVGVPEYPGLPPAVYIDGLYPFTAMVDTLSGWVAEFTGSFIMPSSGVKIHIYSYWYGADGYWHLDNEKTKDVKLTELVPSFSEFSVASFSKV